MSVGIEIVSESTPSAEVKGRLLEELAARLLRAQNFSVLKQVRLTGAELDLLCEHRISGRKLYVECKGHREPLGASVIKQLIGTVILLREAFVLFAVEGLSYAELAAIAGASVGTLQVRVHRAKALLRQQLGARVDTWWARSS